MAKRKAASEKTTRKVRPALTPDARDNQLISAAYDLAEKQILEGTASSQVLTHFLKLGTVKYQLELEEKRTQNELNRSKAESIKSQQKTEEMYREALRAMRSYSGAGDIDDDEPEDQDIL